MADTGVNIEETEMETEKKLDVSDSSDSTTLAGLQFQASQVIERLEEAVEKAEETTNQPQVIGGLAWKNSHAFLPPQSKHSQEVLSQLEDLLLHEDPSNQADSQDEDSPLNPNIATLPQLDEAGRLSIVSHSISAYSSSLERSHLQKLNARLTSDTTRWFSHLFRFYDCAAFFHDDMLEGVVRITRMMLHYKYPRFIEDGYEAVTSHLPVIYSSVASPLGLVQYVCRQLGLPVHCVRPVPCNTLFGSQQKIDVAALERFMEEDKANGRIPLIVLADAGTPIAGHVDNLPRLEELCRQHDVWLHLRGHCLAALAMVNVHNIQTKIADSFTLPIGIWLGIPALPIVTLYRLFDTNPRSHRNSTAGSVRESTLPLVSGLVNDHFTRRLNCLPLWTTLQNLGRDGLQMKIRQAFESSEQIWKRISKYPCLQLLCQQPGGEAGNYTISELVSKPVSTTLMLEVVTCTVVFQFIPENSTGERIGRVPPYYDKLNSWLGQILQRDSPHVPIEICELDTNGVVLRYCPLEMSGEPLPTSEEVDQFVTCLEQQLDILVATVQHKETFQRLVEASPRLRLVEMPGWAGLGGVRYVPEAWEQILTDQAKEELNRLNMQLVDTLRNSDAAFSLGEGTDGLVCVRFGMVTADTDVEELLALVVTVGKEVEESSKFLETMTEIVKKGIETATMDLQKENEERLWQEGILRQVPVFGSLVNWWSPPSKEGGIKGRSLNLTEGVVESTENIYRYHMQLSKGTNPPPGSKSPPTPQVQTPVVTGSHSRSSSHSSHQSQSVVE